jgi:16S rRNA (guanine966-N2)-methyltransferase
MRKSPKKSSIRIIAGEWRGRRLPVLDAEGLRPTTDRIRETLFNWLMHDLQGAKCLDVFAGSGVLGFECLSRGADFVQFCDANVVALNNIRSSIELLDPQLSKERTKLLSGDALKMLTSPASTQFDIVFLDPPYRLNLIGQCTKLLEQNGWLTDHAIIYIELPKRSRFEVSENWQVSKEGSAGQSQYRLYRR